ncbi:MAG: hypothetical protein IPK85_10050 [Gemmatimonadetes bacterium]|nr:hypothetical protein [Gemmatimonadota bacterium]
MSRPRINAREARTIGWGATVAMAALVFTFGVLPVARRWSAREDAITMARERVARLEGMLATAAPPHTPGAMSAPLLLRGRTSDLAGSALQATLQELARTSRVSITRLEVLPDSADPATGVRASLSATTDVYGLADLLSRLQGHAPVLAAVELSVSMNPVLRGNLLQLSLGVQAPWVPMP